MTTEISRKEEPETFAKVRELQKEVVVLPELPEEKQKRNWDFLMSNNICYHDKAHFVFRKSCISVLETQTVGGQIAAA